MLERCDWERQRRQAAFPHGAQLGATDGFVECHRIVASRQAAPHALRAVR
jgi:hypothetical protein